MTDRALILACADGSPAGTAAAVDLLQEQGVTLADVLLLYAGQPPDWLAPTHDEDEALRILLAKWCEVTEPNRLTPGWTPGSDGVPSIDRHPEAPFCWPYRSGAVRAFDLTGVKRLMPDSSVWTTRTSPLYLVRARRAQKRAVLALFPDVTREGIAAPDWIPLEPELEVTVYRMGGIRRAR